MQYIIDKSTFEHSLEKLNFTNEFKECAKLVVFTTHPGSPYDFTIKEDGNLATTTGESGGSTNFYVLKVSTPEKREEVMTLAHNRILPKMEECWICEQHTILFMKLPPIISLEKYLKKYAGMSSIKNDNMESFALILVNLFYKFKMFHMITSTELDVSSGLNLFGVDLKSNEVILRFNYTLTNGSSKTPNYKKLRDAVEKILGKSNQQLLSILGYIYSNYRGILEDIEPEQVPLPPQQEEVPIVGAPIGVSVGPPVGMNSGPPIGMSAGPPVGMNSNPLPSVGPPPIVQKKEEKKKEPTNFVEQISGGGFELKGPPCSEDDEKPCADDRACNIGITQCKKVTTSDIKDVNSFEDVEKLFEDDKELNVLTFKLDGRKYSIDRDNLPSLKTFFIKKNKTKAVLKPGTIRSDLDDGLAKRRQAVVNEDDVVPDEDWE